MNVGVYSNKIEILKYENLPISDPDTSQNAWKSSIKITLKGSSRIKDPEKRIKIKCIFMSKTLFAIQFKCVRFIYNRS